MVNGPAEGAGTVVIEVGHAVYLSSAAAGGEHSAALGCGEGPYQLIILILRKSQFGYEVICDLRGLGETSGNAFHGFGEFRVSQAAVASYREAVCGSCDQFRQYNCRILGRTGRMLLSVRLQEPPVIVVSSIHGTPGKCQGCPVRGDQAYVLRYSAVKILFLRHRGLVTSAEDSGRGGQQECQEGQLSKIIFH